ncbi:hypothetical protein [Candidatus Williamhamiltonella defendens]|uniref:hypothetical protein n=1 Tax=Candidatus Williamhamiltonella defendens TaxID=138072 RepID=UPI0002E8DC20|nr:hypothetical protein [Candidatus Hamiltonella defensa]
MKIIGWFFGIIFILTALGACSKGSWMEGIFLALAAFLALPAANQWMNKVASQREIDQGKEPSPPLKLGGGIAISLVVAIMGIIFFSSGKETHSQDTASLSQAKQATKNQKVSAEKITPLIHLDQFRSDFNDFLSDIGLYNEYAIGELNHTTGPVNDTFKYSFSNSIRMLGTLQKDKKILKDVIIISIPKGLKEETFITLMIIGALIGTLSPDLEKNDRGRLITSLINQSVSSGKKSSEKVGNVKYFAIINNQLGFWFGAEML